MFRKAEKGAENIKLTYQGEKNMNSDFMCILLDSKSKKTTA